MRNMQRRYLLLGAALLGAIAAFYLPGVLDRALVSGEVDTSALSGGRTFASIGVAWLGGVLTSLTPCVYPLIPITVAIFGATQARRRLHAVGLSATYVLGMAVMFSTLGFFAASSGKLFGGLLANPWIAGALGVFFLAMAASLFGAFSIALPEGVARRLGAVGGVGFGGAFAMGLVAGIIAAPCTGPVLASLLTFVASSGSPSFGFMLLFAYALGVGLPFMLLGGFSVSLPKSGPWMEGVKSLFGVVLTVLALGYLQDALPSLRAALGGLELPQVIGPALVALGILAGGLHLSFSDGGRERLAKGAGVLLLVAGLSLRLAAPGVEQRIDWHDDVDAAIELAQESGLPVMIDFTAEWCAACKELERYTFSDAQVAQEAEGFVSVQVDGTHEDETVEALYERFGVQGLPTVVFLAPGGELLDEPRVTGFVDADRFLSMLREVRGLGAGSGAEAQR